MSGGLQTIGAYQLDCLPPPPQSDTATGGLANKLARSFKSMVRTLPPGSLRLILDVVYNHTGEGTFSAKPCPLRGVDNALYLQAQAG